MRLASFLLAATIAIKGVHAEAAELSLAEALELALTTNAPLSAARAEAEGSRALVGARGSLSSPRVGLMQERNMYGSGMGMMRSLSVSQEVLFPPKYFLMAGAQSAEADQAREEYLDKRLELRKRLTEAYVNLFVARKIFTLFEAQRETLREVARIAEVRRATGAVPQQDEMKAHSEQTKLENEIILQEQEVREAEAALNALLNRPAETAIEVSGAFVKPELRLAGRDPQELAVRNSKSISSRRFATESAARTRALSKWAFVPDFMLSYRKPVEGAPKDAYAFGIELSVPLWFFFRERNEARAASARLASAEAGLEGALLQARADVKSLKARAESANKVLRVYETSLIPQATSTLNSSRAAYSAGRVGFQELLDSERSLYDARIASLRMLAKYISSLADLERVVGTSLSSLPFGDAL